jgi:rhodanese-related sulfurtransferase
VTRLTEANAIVPNLPDVKRTLAEADKLVKNPPPRPFPWIWVAFGVTFVSAGAYGGMFARRWWKNRYRILPTQVIGLLAAGKAPALVDVRTRDDYETSPLKLPGAHRLSPEEVDAGRVDLVAEKSQTLVAYDTSPGEATSERVAHALRKLGWRDVRILKGGLGGWTNAKLPMEAKSSLPSIGIELYKNLTLGDMEKRHFDKGTVICKEGDDPHGEAYLVHAGAVEIRRRENGTFRVLTQLGEGQLVGQMALFRKERRSADIVAATDVDLLVIMQERLEWLIHNRPEVTVEILKSLSDDVARANRQGGASPPQQ